jgi:hypothetical protein
MPISSVETEGIEPPHEKPMESLASPARNARVIALFSFAAFVSEYQLRLPGWCRGDSTLIRGCDPAKLDHI